MSEKRDQPASRAIRETSGSPTGSSNVVAQVRSATRPPPSKMVLYVISFGAAILSVIAVAVSLFPRQSFFGFGNGEVTKTDKFEMARRFHIPVTIPIVLRGKSAAERRAALQVLIDGIEQKLDAGGSASLADGLVYVATDVASHRMNVDFNIVYRDLDDDASQIVDFKSWTVWSPRVSEDYASRARSNAARRLEELIAEVIAAEMLDKQISARRSAILMTTTEPSA